MSAGSQPERWPELMKVHEVAAVMRVSKMTVYRLIHSGELPSTKVGKRGYRIPKTDLQRYLAEGEQW